MSDGFGIANSAPKASNLTEPHIRNDEIWSVMTRFELGGAQRANVIVIDEEQVLLDLMP